MCARRQPSGRRKSKDGKVEQPAFHRASIVAGIGHCEDKMLQRLGGVRLKKRTRTPLN
jgi:catalase